MCQGHDKPSGALRGGVRRRVPNLSIKPCRLQNVPWILGPYCFSTAK